MKIVAPDEAGLAAAVKALRAGDVVACPTDTVYGLAVDPFSEEALARLFTIKERDPANPVLLIVADPDQIEKVAGRVSQTAQRLMDHFWPGPLSLLLPALPTLPDALTAGGGKVCVRQPDCDVARRLCALAGGPLTSTSANRSGEPPARSIDELDVPNIAVAVDAGPLPPSRPSTVYDPETGEIVRAGAIDAEALRAVAAETES